MANENFSEGKAEEPRLVDNGDWSLEAENEGKSRGWLTPLLLGVAMGSAIAFGGMRLAANRPAQNAPTAAQKVAPSMTVTVTPAVATQVARSLTPVGGTVEARNLIAVVPQGQVQGVQIKQVLVKEGDSVQAGQPVAILDDAAIQAQISKARADVSSRQADVGTREADLASKQAAVAAAQAQVQQRQADLLQAQAQLREAQTNFQRNQELKNAGAISQQTLDTSATTLATARAEVGVAQANIRNAQENVRSAQQSVRSAQASVRSTQEGVRGNNAEVQRLRSTLAQTVVRAPAAGIVAKPRVNDQIRQVAQVGDVASSSQPLFSIIADGALELQVRMPTSLLAQVKEGAIARITSDVDRSLRLEGRVRQIEQLVDQQNRQAIVSIDLPPTNLLRPGVFAKAAITTSTTQGVVVPQKAVQPQPDNSALVFMLSGEDIVRAQKVEVGEVLNGNRVEIRNGVRPGDKVIIDGAGYVKDGDRVRVVQTP